MDEPPSARIPLTQGKEATIDAADLPRVQSRRWYAIHMPVTGQWMAATGHTKTYLHHFILDAGPDLVVTHVNGDGLDNRRANLRRWRKPKRRAES